METKKFWIKFIVMFIFGFIGGYGISQFCKTGNHMFLLCLIPTIVNIVYLMVRK